jgi:hypothetical protein
LTSETFIAPLNNNNNTFIVQQYVNANLGQIKQNRKFVPLLKKNTEDKNKNNRTKYHYIGLINVTISLSQEKCTSQRLEMLCTCDILVNLKPSWYHTNY